MNNERDGRFAIDRLCVFFLFLVSLIREVTIDDSVHIVIDDQCETDSFRFECISHHDKMMISGQRDLSNGNINHLCLSDSCSYNQIKQIQMSDDGRCTEYTQIYIEGNLLID
jgi:hypothetical protein